VRPAGGNASKRVADTSPGPWRDWKTRSRHGRAIRFIETYCAPAKGKGHGKPLKLAKFQKDWLKAALTDGVEVAVLETPRGNGKSTFGGAIAVWAVFDDMETGAPQVPVIATTVKQAIRSCYGAAVSMIRRNPELMSRALIFTGFADPRVEVPFNEGEMFPIQMGCRGWTHPLHWRTRWASSRSSHGPHSRRHRASGTARSPSGSERPA